MNSYKLFGNAILFDSSNIFFFLQGIELHNLVFPLKKQTNFITLSLSLFFEFIFHLNCISKLPFLN